MSFRDLVFSTALRDGATTAAHLSEISGKPVKIVTENVRNMVSEGLLIRRPGIEGHIEYAVTEKGREHYKKWGRGTIEQSQPKQLPDRPGNEPAATAAHVVSHTQCLAPPEQREEIELQPMVWQSTAFELAELGEERWFTADPRTRELLAMPSKAAAYSAAEDLARRISEQVNVYCMRLSGCAALDVVLKEA